MGVFIKDEKVEIIIFGADEFINTDRQFIFNSMQINAMPFRIDKILVESSTKTHQRLIECAPGALTRVFNGPFNHDQVFAVLRHIDPGLDLQWNRGALFMFKQEIILSLL